MSALAGIELKLSAVKSKMNIRGSNLDETKSVITTNTVHYQAEYPSHLELPVVPQTK